MTLIAISDTDLELSHSFGREQFTGVVGVKADNESCPNDILLLPYIDGKLTGQFMPHERTLRSLSDAEDLVPISQTTKGGQLLTFNQDSGPINIETGKYRVQFFPGNDLYYAAAQYTALGGGCSSGDCEYMWLVENDSTSIEGLYKSQLYVGDPYGIPALLTPGKSTVDDGTCKDESSLSAEDQDLPYINIDDLKFS